MTPAINFVVDRSSAQMARLRAVSSMDDCFERTPDLAAGISSHGDLCWCLQSYLILAEQGQLTVRCSNVLNRDAINVVHSAHLARIGGSADAFVVCARADFPARRWAHHHLVQNRLQAGAGATYLPLWPQPRLKKRNPERRGVERVAYVGQTFNGNLALNEREWRRAFEGVGVDFVVPHASAWNDVSEIDVLIGVRSFDRRTYPGKPPSKLVNAWLAEAPFIGGFDSAYAQVGTPGMDYIRVERLEDAVAAVDRLRRRPQDYRRFVANGVARGRAFTRERIAELWVEALSGEIAERYDQWLRREEFERARFHVLRGIGRVEVRSRAAARRIRSALGA